MPTYDITLTIEGQSYGLTYMEASRVLQEIAAAYRDHDLSREIEITPLGKESDGAIHVTVGFMSSFSFEQQVS